MIVADHNLLGVHQKFKQDWLHRRIFLLHRPMSMRVAVKLAMARLANCLANKGSLSCPGRSIGLYLCRPFGDVFPNRFGRLLVLGGNFQDCPNDKRQRRFI